MISCEDLYPKFEDSIREVGQVSKAVSLQNSVVKLWIYSCDIKFCDREICGWVKIFDKIQGKLKEETVIY
jgi:hypothetical protein